MAMAMILAFHKPYGVLSQFTSDGSPNDTLASFGFPPDVYAVGRLDADSEGLLILARERGFANELLDPKRRHPREYWVQVEGIPSDEALAALEAGVDIKTGRTLPCHARLMEPPELPDRDPPIRFRKTVPDRWLALSLVEGKNRQVRRMTAAVGHPTLRLVRARIGQVELGDLARGTWRELTAEEGEGLFR